MNINGFIWSIADDVLHHVYDRTKYRDIILPMTVIRRLDAVLEPTRAAVLARKAELDAAGVPEAAQGPALDRAAGQAFHNRSPFTLRQLLARPNPVTMKGKAVVVAYEPNKALSDTEIVAFDESGGIEAFFEREVLPHAPDAWIDREKTKIGYEISFARHFYKPKPPRPLAEIKAEIDALERQTQDLLDAVLIESDA
jgi:type I restriction-modification system DNA methylase subunit